MRNLFLIFAFTFALFLFAQATSAQSFSKDNKASESQQSWGFILSERDNLIDRKNYIGYGGFSDEVSCKVEAEKYLAKLTDPSKFEALCFSPFQILTPYKVAQ